MDAVLSLFSHAGNCHGEWHLILTALGGLPFLGVWIRRIRSRK